MGKYVVRVVPVVVVLVIGFIILLVGAILNPVFTAILHKEFKSLLPLSAKSSTLSTWEDPRDSVDMYMKFYFFDLLNPEEVAAGGKPNVAQKGPYVYNEIKVKKNVTFDSADSTATFVSPRSMVFNRSMSAGDQNDTFVTINVPLIAIVTMLQAIPLGEEALSLAIRSGFIKNESLFKRLSVYELLWGYRDPLMSSIAEVLDIFHLKLPMPMDGFFGFFYKKNDTDDGVYTVKTGQDDLSKFMQITQWNHNSSLSYWKTKYCNMINGTDGTMYHPFIKTKESLSIFSSDLCRSINVVYNSKHFLEDVPQYRFKPPSSLFDYPPQNEDSACYCVGKACPHGGVLNISACQQGAPVFVSQPHFLNGDYYQATVDGMNPNETLHNTYIDVEPTTGIVMKGAKRLQMNLAVEHNAHVKEMAKIRAMLFPLLWLEESALINDNGMNTFKKQFFTVQQWVTFSSYLLIAVGGFIVVCTLVYVSVKYRNYRKAQKTSSAPNERSPLINPHQEAHQPDNDWGKMSGNDQ